MLFFSICVKFYFSLTGYMGIPLGARSGIVGVPAPSTSGDDVPHEKHTQKRLASKKEIKFYHFNSLWLVGLIVL